MPWSSPIVLKNSASVLPPCVVKLLRLWVSTSACSSCYRYAYVQPVPEKGDRSNLSKASVTRMVPRASFGILPPKDARKGERVVTRLIPKATTTSISPQPKQKVWIVPGAISLLLLSLICVL